MQAHLMDSISGRRSRKWVGITLVGLILHITEIPALKQESFSRCGRFNKSSSVFTPNFCARSEVFPQAQKDPAPTGGPLVSSVSERVCFSDSRQTHPPLNGMVWMHRAIQMWVVQEIPGAEEEVWEIRQFDASPIPASIRNWCKLAQQKAALNLFVRFDLCTTNPKE
jgi:hypothetical protein